MMSMMGVEDGVVGGDWISGFIGGGGGGLGDIKGVCVCRYWGSSSMVKILTLTIIASGRRRMRMRRERMVWLLALRCTGATRRRMRMRMLA